MPGNGWGRRKQRRKRAVLRNRKRTRNSRKPNDSQVKLDGKATRKSRSFGKSWKPRREEARDSRRTRTPPRQRRRQR